MWKTPQKAITSILFLIAGLGMIAAGALRPDEGWISTVMIIAGVLFLINALLQWVLRSREQRERDSNDR
ncbi:hypothetical protein [Agrococcus casei]|uniref:hypothetical protein n=1 Tax=Agrococcus casei TaxID=343512 RepID=UPI003F8EA072